MIEIRRIFFQKKNIDQKEAGENPRGDRHISDWDYGYRGLHICQSPLTYSLTVNTTFYVNFQFFQNKTKNKSLIFRSEILS